MKLLKQIHTNTLTRSTYWHGGVSKAMGTGCSTSMSGSGFISGGSMWDKSLKEWAVLLSAVFAIVGTYPFVHFCRCLVKTGVVGKAFAWCGNYSMQLLFIHGIVQLFICAILGLEPFRMSYFCDENDFRTFYVLALEIVASALVVIAIGYLKKLLFKKKTIS